MSEAAAIIELTRSIDAQSLERARRVARFDAAREYEQRGLPNSIAFLKSECNLSAGAALDVLNVARRLHELPAVEAATEQGLIGFGQAAVIAESADVLAHRQEEIVAKAEELDPARLRVEVRRIAMQEDAERMKREAEWAYRSRFLKLETWRDGRIKLDGLLDAEGGTKVKKALEAALGRRAKDEKRSEGQRRADALVDVAARALGGRKSGQTGGQVPHVNITVELETLVGLRDDPGSLAGAGPVLCDTIERHLCDAALCFSVLHDARVLLAGKEKRTFSGPLRRALMLKRQGCEFPSCDRSADWCEGHHLLAFLHRGKTLPGNGSLLCGYHHRLVHEGGWSVEREEGELVAINPQGELFRSTKAPPAA